MENFVTFREIALEMILERMVAVTETGCWLWTGSINRHGYPFVTVRFGIEQRRYSVYPMIYQHYNGKVPFGKVVRHACNVRACINPGHLISGSRKENTADMVKARRAAWQQKKGHVPLAEIEDISSRIIEYRELPEPPEPERKTSSASWWWKTPGSVKPDARGKKVFGRY